jgi:hypothetical protein
MTQLDRAVDITLDRIKSYVRKRQEEGAAKPSTANWRL